MTEAVVHLTGRPSKAQMIKITSVVLDTAREFFSTRGFSGTSMDEIADHAGITKRTIYRRYPSKFALLEAVVEQEILKFHDWLKGAEPGETCIERLRNTAFRSFEYINHPDVVRFSHFLAAQGNYSDELREKLIEWEDVSLAPMIELIQKAQQSGYLIDTDIKELGYLLMDLIDVGSHARNFERYASSSNEKQSLFFNYRWEVFVNSVATDMGKK